MFYRSRKTLPIYDSIWLDVVISDDYKKLNKEFETSAEEREWFACVFRNNFQIKQKNKKEVWRKSIVVVLNPNHIDGSKITQAIMVHEAVHIKNMVFAVIGHKSTHNNDEPEAYFVEFLFNVIDDFYKECLKKEKKLTAKKIKNEKK